MIALRKIMAPKVWEPCLARGYDAANLPGGILVEFVPTREERDHYSVYVVPNADAAASVAAAMAMASGAGPARTLFAEAPVEQLTKAGLELTVSPGETFAASVDACHRNLRVPDQNSLIRAAAAFASNDSLIIEAEDVRLEIVALTRNGAYDFPSLASKRTKPTESRIWSSTLELVASRHVVVLAASTV